MNHECNLSCGFAFVMHPKFGYTGLILCRGEAGLGVGTLCRWSFHRGFATPHSNRIKGFSGCIHSRSHAFPQGSTVLLRFLWVPSNEGTSFIYLQERPSTTLSLLLYEWLVFSHREMQPCGSEILWQSCRADIRPNSYTVSVTDWIFLKHFIFVGKLSGEQKSAEPTVGYTKHRVDKFDACHFSDDAVASENDKKARDKAHKLHVRSNLIARLLVVKPHEIK